MSLTQRCDMCGKVEGSKGTTFDSRPVSVQVKNHKGEPYNVYAIVVIENAEDVDLSRKFMENNAEVVDKVVRRAMKEGS